MRRHQTSVPSRDHAALGVGAPLMLTLSVNDLPAFTACVSFSASAYSITGAAVTVTSTTATPIHTELEPLKLVSKYYTTLHPFNGLFSATTQVSEHQKGKTNLDFTEARDSEWQWHQLGHVQVCN